MQLESSSKMEVCEKINSKVNNQAEDHLIVKKKGGGSIIDRRPLFSSSGETLYVIWKKVIHKYSTLTGDLVGEFEPAETKLIGISYYSDNFNTIVGCTESGDLINWNSQNGVITRKLKLNLQADVKVTTFHNVNYQLTNGRVICQVLLTYLDKSQNEIQLMLFDMDSGEMTKSKAITAQADYYVDVIGNYGHSLIAVGQDVDFHILYPQKDLEGRLHRIGGIDRKITCLTGHPEEECVAIGDSSGRVAVYKNLFHNRPIHGVYHWHTLPVSEIAFSKSGGHMYTGGSECVLVKWTLANPHHKSFLPRLPAPIKHLTIAPENLYVAVSTLDNGIVIVTPQRKLTSVIQNFTWGVTASRKELFPAGLTLDPRSGSLVLNSRTGHVQFFDAHRKALLYNINITGQNFLTQERDTIVVNTEVTKVALNQDGTWLATIEEWHDRVSSPEIRLKFWKFDAEKQNFYLNTSTELPHDIGINCLQFQPNSSLAGDKVTAVTTGKDHKFKVWSLMEGSSSNATKKVKHWICTAVENYRDLEATDAGFSMDGSLLGVCFDSTLTIWMSDEVILKSHLIHKKFSSRLKRVVFGKNESRHLVVVGSNEHMAVWNVLTLNQVWSVSIKLAVLTPDPCSNFMAAFSTDNTLFVFNLQSSILVYTKKNIVEADSAVLGACFVPILRECKGKSFCDWQRKSQLFFIDDNQELLTLEDKREGGALMENLGLGNFWPSTAFSQLIAEETTTNVQDDRKNHVDEYLGNGKGFIDQFLKLSVHTTPSITKFCAPFILSLSGQEDLNSKNLVEMNFSHFGNSHGPLNSDESDDDYEPREDKKLTKIEITASSTNGYHDNDDNDVTLDSLDWSFLVKDLLS